jgi:hypothetical protein
MTWSQQIAKTLRNAVGCMARSKSKQSFNLTLLHDAKVKVADRKN